MIQSATESDRMLMQRWLNCQCRPSALSCASLHKVERAPRAYISRFTCVFDEVDVLASHVI